MMAQEGQAKSCASFLRQQWGVLRTFKTLYSKDMVLNVQAKDSLSADQVRVMKLN